MKRINWYGERQNGSLIYAESNYEMLCLKEKGFDMTPLYELDLQEIDLLQAQTKPLSDEEIESIWNDGIVGWYGSMEESVLKFARAIEAKVRGEK